MTAGMGHGRLIAGLVLAWATGWAAEGGGDRWLVVQRTADEQALVVSDRMGGPVLRRRVFSAGIRWVAPLGDAAGVLVCEAAPARVVEWNPGTDAVVPVAGLDGLSQCIAAPDGSRLGIANVEPTGDGIGPGVAMLVRRRADGRGLHRLAMDLMGSADPAVLEDGRILATRWQPAQGKATGGLVVMNPDGTLATGLVAGPPGGVIRQARGMPGGMLVVAIASSAAQADWGWLVRCDPARGQGFAQAAQPWPADQGRFAGDTWGCDGGQYRHPWPVSEHEVLAAWRDRPGARAVIVRVVDGRREVVWADPAADLDQPIRLQSGRAAPARPDLVDWLLPHGWIYIQDARLMADGERAAVTEVRVSVLRPGPSVGQATVEPGRIALGTVPVEADGSLFAQVPAREPLAFTLLDAQGRVVRDMAGWTTVQRGERVSCLGCHVPPTIAPARGGAIAFGKPPVELRLPAGVVPDPQRDSAWASAERRRIQDMIVATFGGR